MDDSDNSPAPLVGEVLGNRYRLDAVLGTGGMGCVYLATDEQLSQRRVAVKVPHREFLLVPGFRERFGHEIRQLINLEHPHIVTILDSGEFDGQPFAVLQYLGGGNLDDRIEALGRTMTAAEVTEWLPAVADSLDFIHRRGFLHRDIKPGNIFFDAEGHPFVADFGIALALEGEGFTRVTQAGMLVGSPAYMAPEYGSGELGSAYDQYALAVVVYQCLSGELPHPPLSTPIAYLAKKMVEPPGRLGPLVPGAPRAAVGAVMRALAVEPEERFETCSAFAAAVVDGAADAPVGETHWTRAADGSRPVVPAFGLVPDTAQLAETALMEQGDSAPSAETELADRAPSSLAETELIEEAAPPTAEPAPPEDEPPVAATRPASNALLLNSQREATVQEQPESPLPPVPELRAEWQRRTEVRRPAEAPRRPEVERRPAPDDTVEVLVWNVVRWFLAFAAGFLILEEGSYAIHRLFSPLVSIEAYSEWVATGGQVSSLVAATAAGNLLLGLVAGYVVCVIADRQWSINCVAVAAATVALTAWDTGLIAPLINSQSLSIVSFNGGWLSMAPVPLGLLVGAYARSEQESGRGLGALFAALAFVVVIALRLALS